MNEIPDATKEEEIPIDSIFIGKRLRLPDQDKIDEYAKSMADTGLIHALTVDANYNLIAGMHRLEAAKKLKWQTVRCRVLNVTPNQAKLIEAEENLETSDLTVLDRAIHLAAKDNALAALGLKARRGVTQKNCNQLITTADQSKEAGMNRYHLHKMWQIARNIPENARDALLKSTASNKFNLLLEISKIPDAVKKTRVALAVARLPDPTIKKVLPIFQAEGLEIKGSVRTYTRVGDAVKQVESLAKILAKVDAAIEAAAEQLPQDDALKISEAPGVVTKLKLLLSARGIDMPIGDSVAERSVVMNSDLSWRSAAMKPIPTDADARGEVLVWNAAVGTVGRAPWDELKPEHSHWQKIVSPWGLAAREIEEECEETSS